MRKYSLLLLLLTLASGLSAQKFDPQRKIRFAEQIIEDFYVDTLNMNQVVEEGIIAMLKTLDPHSTYTNAEETKSLTEPLQGNFSGIGIQFNMINDTLYVIQTISGGPSEKVGILPGDRIISANDTIIAGVKMANTDIQKHLRGPKGSIVNVDVLRRGEAHPLGFRIERDDIPIYSVDASYMAAPNVGYIRISRFAESTPKEVMEALTKLKKEGMRDLIVDLEDNGGGYLGAAFQLSDIFLPKEAPVVYTEGIRFPATHYKAENEGPMLDGRLVVMVNQYSASASEIFSGAMQDNDRGVIIGRRTFGKGLVQRPFPLPDGSMIRLTTMRYYTPSGRSIQKPYTAGDPDSYRSDIIDRYNSGELMSADSVHFADSLKYHTLKLRRPVYGGGGIMPDKFVPIDTTFYTTYYRDLVAKGIINRFCINYVDKNRKDLLIKYKNEDSYIDNFHVTPDIITGLVSFAESEGISPNADQLATSREYISYIIKGIIGRDLYDQSTYFRVTNNLNPIYNKALETIRTKEYEEILRKPA